MFEIGKVIESLKAKGVKFHVANERLICDAPKGVIKEDVAQEIKENKKLILEYLSQFQDVGKQTGHIKRIEGKTSAPQTLSVQRLMFMEQLVYGKSSFNLPVAIKLTGNVNSEIFERCLQEIVDRQEIFRSTFLIENGEPVQKIYKNFNVKLEIVDLLAEKSEAKKDYTSLMIETGKKSFDLSVLPLFKFMLIKIKENESVFFFVKPSIIWDGWSFDIFLNELDTLYGAYLAGKSTPLPKLDLQYSDYAIWYDNRIQGKEIAKQIEYWRIKLPKNINYLQLPYDHQRNLESAYQGNRKSFKISQDKVNQIAQICNEENATLFIGFLTIFRILIYRYTSQNDIIIGLPMWNRVRPEFENVIGHFVNIVLFHTHIQPNQNFRQLLNSVKVNFFEAFNNQEAPFEKVTDDLKLVQEVGGAPIYQLYFSYQDARNRQEKIGNLETEQVYVHSSSAANDLSFWLKESEQDMAGAIDYSSDLFEPETIDKFINHYFMLMDSIIECPDASISSLTILTEKEIAILSDWNRTEKKYDLDKSIGLFFKETAGQYADKIAVEFGKEHLSYKELDYLSDDLAGILKSKVANPNSFIGVLTDPSIDTVIAMLGILKSGNIFVPMDPTLPEKRLRYLIDDSKVSIIVTQKRHEAFCKNIPIDFFATDPKRDLSIEKIIEPEEVISTEKACLIYVPSPHGDPVGVEVSHKSLLNLVAYMNQTIGIAEKDNFLVISNFSHGVSTLEILLPLLTGAKIKLSDNYAPNDIQSLKDQLIESDPTVMHAPPFIWRKLVDAGWKGSNKIKILIGRERLTKDLAFELIPKCHELWNMFGTVETTFWSAAHKIDADSQSSLIGRPIANTRIYVLDEQMQPVPVGGTGKLFIGGTGVARSYRNRPELTAERFMADPFSKEPGAKMYRTCDLGRFLPDGSIEYLGRVDRLVKIHGFRIELGEIETVLGRHPAVHQAAVNAVNNGTPDARLVAYIIFMPKEHLTVSEVRRYLRQHLPEYMVPGLVVEMDVLPLTPNGKIDRRALPDPMEKVRAGLEFVPPKTPLENLVAGIWQNLLKVELVGRHDNFYELGGHSLLSMRVVAAIEKETGHRLNPRQLFFQTLEQVTANVKSGKEAGS